MPKSKNCLLLLENLRSVENTASIFRTAEGLGVSQIILVGTTPTPLDRFGRIRKNFAKVSLGSEKMVKWEYVSQKDFLLTISKLQKKGYQIISLELTHESTPLKEARSEDKFALVVGNEVEGVSPEVLKLSDDIVEIPMRGKKESLNVSVATGVALFVLIYY